MARVMSKAAIAQVFTEKITPLALEVGHFREQAEKFELGEYSEEGFLMTIMNILLED